MSTSRDYAAVTSVGEAKILAQKLLTDGKLIGFDIETGYSGDPYPGRALDPNHADQFIVGFSITNDPSWARYLPLRHDNAPENLPPQEIWEIFEPVLTTLQVVAHHKKFEDKNIKVLHLKGDHVRPIETLVGHDSMIEAYVLGQYREMNLKFLSEFILGVKQMTFKELFELHLGKEISTAALKKVRFNSLPVDQSIIDYACDDAALCLELHNYFEARFAEEPKGRNNILWIENHISHLMSDMELHGVAVDWKSMEVGYSQYPDFEKAMSEAVRNYFQEYVPNKDLSTLNFSSAPQMRELLYTDMLLPVSRMTKGGKKSGPQPSTDKTALEALSRVNDAVKLFLELREVEVMGSRHKKWLNEASHAMDNRAHAEYNQVQVPTGRFSASNPAIQQVPKKWFWSAVPECTLENKDGFVNGRDYWYGNFRDYIVATPDHYLLTYDVSQGELRVLAGVSQEKRLLEAFSGGEDIHVLTAAMMLDKEPEDITDEDRQIGKALPVWEKVLTPKGWVLMGDLRVGDIVVTPTGTAKIKGVYPQGKRPVFRVNTTDGGTTFADAEHLWETSRGLLTTAELVKGDSIPTAVSETTQNVYKLPIDPYTFGVLMAAAHFSGPAIRAELSVGDEWILNRMRLPKPVKWRKYRHKKGERRIDYVFSAGREKSREFSDAWSNPLETALKGLGYRGYNGTKRSGIRSHEKRLPKDWLHLSVEDRKELLYGLMDARGEVVHGLSAMFRTVSFDLAHDVRELVLSLGGRARITKRKTSWDRSRRRGNSEYKVYITTSGESPFTIPYKAYKWDAGIPVLRTIESVTPDGERQEECVCIALDDGKGLFIAGDYMVTHNTMNFALLYQMGEKSLADRLAIPLHKAEELYANYFKQFTSIANWIDKAKREGRQKYYAETFLGRKMPLWGYESTNRRIQGQAERGSVNYPIQGGLADIVKVSMIRSYQALKNEGLWGNGVMLIMNQHDSLTFEVSNSLHPEKVRDILHNAASFPLQGFPEFVIDWELGQRWGSSTQWKPGVPVYQDDSGYWHVGEGGEAPEPVQEKPKKETVPVVPVLTHEAELHVFVERLSKSRVQEFFALIKKHPGDAKVVLKYPDGQYELPVRTSLTVKDSSRISLALDGAIVRVPEESASLAALSAEIELED